MSNHTENKIAFQHALHRGMCGPRGGLVLGVHGPGRVVCSQGVPGPGEGAAPSWGAWYQGVWYGIPACTEADPPQPP